MNIFETIGQKALFSLDPETAHRVSIKALKCGIVPFDPSTKYNKLEQTIAGLSFPNPIGLAAGYDKNGEVPDAILKLGFGFTEVGTVTPRAQSGNPKPRIFRLSDEMGVINRLGFNNEGHQALLKRLEARRHNTGIVGVNIGANKDADDFVSDYEAGISTFSDLASYFTVNISSPNTPGLRNLQAGEALKTLLERIFIMREKQSRQPPIFLKVAPDLSEKEIDEITKVISNSSLDGVMISNTTLSRSNVQNNKISSESGGLSGKPLFERSTIVLAKFAQRLPSKLPLIGIGGVSDAEAAWDKLEAGASLVQTYSCMVYKGPKIAHDICSGLTSKLEREGLNNIAEVTGTKTAEWATKQLEE